MFSGMSVLLNKMVSKYNTGSTVFTMTTLAISTLFAIPFLFVDFQLPQHPRTWVLAMLSASIYGLSVFFSFKAYKTTDASIVSIIYKFSMVITALFGIFFLKETYAAASYMGLFLLIISTVILFYEKQKISFQVGLLFSLLMAFCGAIAALLDKIILNDFSSFTYVFVNCFLVAFLFSIPKGNIQKGIELFRHNKVILLLQSFFAIGSWVIFLFVLKNTDVSHTYPIYKSLSLLIPTILGITVLKEHSKIKQKILSVIVGAIGIYLLSLR
jgi:bacterial/archaeal transporter family protein